MKKLVRKKVSNKEKIKRRSKLWFHQKSLVKNHKYISMGVKMTTRQKRILPYLIKKEKWRLKYEEKIN